MKAAEEIALKDQEIGLLRMEIQQLKDELAWLKKQIFGQKRERFEEQHPEQLTLDLGVVPQPVADEPCVEETISHTRKKSIKHPGRNPLPAHLKRVERIIEPDEDTTGLVCIGEEVTEVLAKHPARNYVIRYRRLKYLRKDGQGVLIGKLPSRAIEKGIAHESVLADMLVSKYVDHQPLYRQAQILRREGIDIPSSTFSDWVEACARLLEPLYEALKREVTTEAQYLQVDESPIQVLNEPAGSGQKTRKDDRTSGGKSHRGYQWVYLDVDANLVLFDYQKGRGREGPAELLKSFKGYLQTDGYAVYEQYDTHPDITLLGCMAHARRYFIKAQSNDPKRAAYFLDQVGRLYDIERQLKEDQANADEIFLARQTQAKPILQHLADWMIEQYPQVLPKSAIGKAIQYAHARWNKICRYIQHGHFRIDNNLIENRIRPLALGRKNWLFAGSHHAAQNTAIFYSILSSAILNGHNPFQYLFAVLTQLPDYPISQINELLPHQLTFEKPEPQEL